MESTPELYDYLLYGPFTPDAPEAFYQWFEESMRRDSGVLLFAIIDKTSPEWRAEDIYARCVMGQAFLFMPDDASQDFVILSSYTCPYSGTKTLSVLAAYSRLGNAVDLYQGELEDMARQANCTAMEFSSPREGWSRHATKHGYEPKFMVYRKAL